MEMRLIGCLIVATVSAGCVREREKQARAPIYENLGSHHHAITTSSPAAQKYFDQGVRLSVRL